MDYPKFNPVKDSFNLRKRVARYLNNKRDFVVRPINKSKISKKQLGFEEFNVKDRVEAIETPQSSITSFLDLISQTVPEGDLYLFGGILRDLALFGSRGFSSDIDLVVEGDWSLIVPRLEKLGAKKNKFGGMRVYHNDIPLDIWLANETWAIKAGHVEYKDVKSLLNTTVLNWDAILMNWRTKSFFCRANYFEDINARYMDVVLENNPNPLGMLVRVLRHILLKDAQSLSEPLIRYLNNAVKTYAYKEIKESEISSYGKNLIHESQYSYFKEKTFYFERIKNNGHHTIENIKNPTSSIFKIVSE
jgi:hypothetical protein